MCGLQDVEDEVAYDDNGGSTVAWAPPRSARDHSQSSSRPRLMDMPQVLRVMRKHFAHVEVLEVAASPSTADFCAGNATDRPCSDSPRQPRRQRSIWCNAVPTSSKFCRTVTNVTTMGTAHVARSHSCGTSYGGVCRTSCSLRSLTAQQAILSRKCRKVFREALARPPAELDVLLRRILSGRDASEGQYLCDELRVSLKRIEMRVAKDS